MPNPSDKVVLFVDVLGFAALTEAHPIDLDGLRAYDHLRSLGELIGRPSNPLSDAFSHFHFQLRSSISLASMYHPLTAITFSDSAFIATEYAHDAVKIAVGLIQGMLSQRVPVRIGIAAGSFVTLRFKSDIADGEGDHSVQFLGTAVVRAHSAETSGIKGIRILLHPSVVPLLEISEKSTSRENYSILPLAENDHANKVGIRHEINYWHLVPTEEKRAWQGLQDMWDKAPNSEVEHYQATAEAINRMRVAQGLAALNKLRRRTLPWNPPLVRLNP